MYLFVILAFDSAQGERAVLPSMGCRGMSSLKACDPALSVHVMLVSRNVFHEYQPCSLMVSHIFMVFADSRSLVDPILTAFIVEEVLRSIVTAGVSIRPANMRGLLSFTPDHFGQYNQSIDFGHFGQTGYGPGSSNILNCR